MEKLDQKLQDCFWGKTMDTQDICTILYIQMYNMNISKYCTITRITCISIYMNNDILGGTRVAGVHHFREIYDDI